MESVRFSLESNLEIWNFIDKTSNHLLISNFRPQNILEFTDATIKLSPSRTLENIEVRNMQFDLRINVSELKQILEFETNFINIYQFNKPIANTLVIADLPNNNRETILMENGLQHIIEVQFESITVSSFHASFIKTIITNQYFKNRIQFCSIDR